MEPVSVKVSFNGEMRRFPFQGASYKALYDYVLGLLALDPATEIVLKYADDEGDLITISSDLELKSAVVPGKLLRLEASLRKSVQAENVQAPGVAPPVQGDAQPAPMDYGYDGWSYNHRGGPLSGEDWKAFKELRKKDKKAFSREEWAAFKEQFKMERKMMKEHCKMSKRGHPHGPHAHGPYFGPHHGPHHGDHHGHHGPHHGGRGGFGFRGRGGPFRGRGGHFPHGPHAGPDFVPQGPGFGPEMMVPPFAPQGVPPPPFVPGPDGAENPNAPPLVDLTPEDGASHVPPFFGPPGFGFGFPHRGGFGHRGGHGPFGHHGGPHHGPFGFPHRGPGFGFGGCGEKQKLVARHVKDVTIEDGTVLASGAAFVKTWRIRNEGAPWPAGCKLIFLSKHSGDNMGSPEYVVVEGAVATNQEIDLSVNLTAPTKPGRYTGYWKMCTPDGRKFGQRVWASIVVPSFGSSSSEGEKEADRYEALVDSVLAMGFHAKRHRVFRLLQKFDGDVSMVCAKLAEKTERQAAKDAKKAAKEAKKASMMTD